MNRSKIYYNIDESEYVVETENFKFYFSSWLYMRKFFTRFKLNRIDMTYKLSSRYLIELNTDDYFDFILYTDIEKRGFKVESKKDGVIFKCLKEVQLIGEIKILKS